MALSQVGIFNLALRHLGQGTDVQDQDEDSEAAAACRRFYEQARDEALRDFPWPFATKVAALGLVEESPVPGWDYAFQVPSDCLFFRRILSGVWEDTPDTRTPCRLGYGTAGEVVYANVSEATAEYTVRVEDPTRYPVDFGQALALLLAAYIAPSVTGGDPAKLGSRALQFYMARVGKAMANAANEEQAGLQKESEFIRVR